MSEAFVATNAASSGITLDRKNIKALCRRSDQPGLKFLVKWVASLLVTGYLVHLSKGSPWLWPALIVYGTVISRPWYAMSHESAHGTAFRTRWLNELAFWITSLIYIEEPLHRRYSHTNHHTYTWNIGKAAIDRILAAGPMRMMKGAFMGGKIFQKNNEHRWRVFDGE
jgi:fatty acid desaturase